MIFSNCFLLCFITIYVLKEGLVFGIKHQNSVNKVEEFIDKLLTSKKFEKLAEKIVQKAVDKILGLQPNLRITDDSKNNFLLEKAVINTTHNTDVQYKRTSSVFKDLSLKYKYFTQSPSDSKQSEENNEPSSVKKPANKTMTKNSMLDTENSTENADSDDVSKQKDSNTDTNENFDVKETSKEHNKAKPKKKKTLKEVKNEEDSISSKNRKAELDELVENKSDSMNHESTVEVRHDDDKNGDFDNMVENDKDLFDNISKDTSMVADMKKKRKKRYRKEGNKIYTFVSSSDYDEYHEELDRLEKQREAIV